MKTLLAASSLSKPMLSAIVNTLMATGIGLVAAIPAVVAYNKLNADSERIIGGYESFADEFATILSRQLDA